MGRCLVDNWSINNVTIQEDLVCLASQPVCATLITVRDIYIGMYVCVVEDQCTCYVSYCNIYEHTQSKV